LILLGTTGKNRSYENGLTSGCQSAETRESQEPMNLFNQSSNQVASIPLPTKKKEKEEKRHHPQGKQN